MGVCKKGINVVNVAAKTINLAKEPLKKRPVKLGIDCHARVPPIPTPPATHIRVCTPEQLRSICPPEPCVCPEVPVPPTGGEKLFALFVLLSKWLFLLGFIKWTDDLGIWGNTESSANLIKDAYKRLSPALKSKSGKEGEEGSKDKDEDTGSNYGFTYNMATMWNNTVGNIFYVIGVLPAAACSKLFSMVNKKGPEEPPPPPPGAKDDKKKGSPPPPPAKEVKNKPSSAPTDAKDAAKKKVAYLH